MNKLVESVKPVTAVLVGLGTRGRDAYGSCAFTSVMLREKIKEEGYLADVFSVMESQFMRSAAEESRISGKKQEMINFK